MELMVSRTSTDSDNKPCDEAYQKQYVYIDRRRWKTPEEITDEITKREWFNEGRNHRIEDNNIMRDFDRVGWFVNIDSLDDLMKFIAKYGNIVIETSYRNHNILAIEIYDDYRE